MYTSLTSRFCSMSKRASKVKAHRLSVKAQLSPECMRFATACTKGLADSQEAWQPDLGDFLEVLSQTILVGILSTVNFQTKNL